MDVSGRACVQIHVNSLAIEGLDPDFDIIALESAIAREIEHEPRGGSGHAANAPSVGGMRAPSVAGVPDWGLAVAKSVSTEVMPRIVAATQEAPTRGAARRDPMRGPSS